MKTLRKNNGEGSIFQTSENKWVAKICIGTGTDGKPIIKQFSAKTEAEVKRKLKNYKKSTDFTAGHKPTDLTVKDYFVKWLYIYRINDLKQASFDRLETTVQYHIIPNLGRMKIDKVTRDDVQGLINTLYSQNGLSYSTVKKVYVALNACYKHAITADLVYKNPCMGITLPSQAERSKQIIAFTDEETERLQAELCRKTDEGENVYYYAPAFMLILHTGMRMGEALSLTWNDINLFRKTITINKNSVMIKNRDEHGHISGGYTIQIQDTPKTVSGNRIIPINKTAEESLYNLKKGNNTPYVIVNCKGKQVLPSNLERSFHAILNNCGLGEHGVHTLRHTFASRLFAKGVDVKVVSELLGHSSVKVTYDIYIHVIPKDISHVTDVLDE